MPTSQVLRGKITGVEGSWVRLAPVNGSLEGAIWDARELYAVPSARSIAPYLATPLDALPGQTVVYRLSDTINGLPAQFCGVEPRRPMSPASGTTALKQYQDVIAELQAMAAITPTDQLEASLIADTEFQTGTPTTSTEAM